MKLKGDIKVQYLGHSTFLITTPKGGRLLIDPWVYSNPVCPEEARQLPGVDTLLITHAHFDHMADAVEIARRFKPKIGCIFELSQWLEKQGVENVSGMNKGGTQQLNDIRATMVQALHSSSIIEEDGTIVYAGEPAGFVIEFDNGYRAYHTGDTCLFGDMALIGELYRPDLLFLPIGDLYTMGPEQAARACKLIKPRLVIPMHYGTFPVLTGTPDRLRELTGDLDLEVIALKPGEEVA